MYSSKCVGHYWLIAIWLVILTFISEFRPTTTQVRLYSSTVTPIGLISQSSSATQTSSGISTSPVPISTTEEPHYCSGNDSLWKCGTNTVCIDGKCRCAFGFIPSANNLDCSPVTCSDNVQCYTKFGNTKCGNSGKCECETNYLLDRDYVCKLDTKQFPCADYRQCGPNGACYNNVCKCELGFESQWIIREDGCTPVKCDPLDNSFCRMKFEGTRCEFNAKSCICDFEHKLDSISQTCVERNPITTTITTVPTTVVTSKSNLCIAAIECSSNLACINGKCDCSADQYLDSLANECRYLKNDDHPKSSNIGMILGIVFGTLAVVILAGGIGFWWYRTKSNNNNQRKDNSRPPMAPKPHVEIIRPSAPSQSPRMSNRSHIHQDQTQQSYNPAYPSFKMYPIIPNNNNNNNQN